MQEECARILVLLRENKMMAKTWAPWHSHQNKFTTTWCYTQSSSVALSYMTLCKPVNCSMSGFPVHYQLPEFAQTHVHRVGDAILSYHPLPSTSSPTFNFSQHQVFFQRVSSSHQVSKVLEFQPQSLQ